MIFKLASRNIFRNKRRTLITATSIALAVFTAASMKSIQKGAWDNMVDSVVNYYVGYAQIHSNGYWEDKTIDRAFSFESAIRDLPNSGPSITQVVPRIESFALAAFGQKSNGTLVIGIDPEKEDQLTSLRTKLVKGEYLKPHDDGILLASGLAEILKVDLQDTIVLLSQGYHGATAASTYPIQGILEFGSPQLNKQMTYLTLESAADFFAAPELITSVAIDVPEPSALPQALKVMHSQLDSAQYEIMDYKEMLPELMQAKSLDTVSNDITLSILYFIIAFGIFGTILMMVKERTYEFGVLLSIGMPRWKLGSVIWIETILLGLLGAILGILLTLPIVYYFNTNPIELTGDAAKVYKNFGVEPIFPAAIEPKIFISQAIIILLMTSVLALYPLWKIKTMDPVKSMRE